MENHKIYAIIAAIFAIILVIIAGKSCTSNIEKRNNSAQITEYNPTNIDPNAPKATAYLVNPNDVPKSTTTESAPDINSPEIGEKPTSPVEEVEATTKKKTLLEEYWEKQEQKKNGTYEENIN